jgi:sulfate transport system permease protein
MKANALLFRCVSLAYLSGLLVIPVGMVVWNAFQSGLGVFLQATIRPTAINALALTLGVGTFAVAGNAIFGVWCALQLVRGGLPRAVSVAINTLVDMPFVISDVVVGVALLALFGRSSTLGTWLAGHGVPVVFAAPGMILATAFVSLPFVVREVVPVLRQHGVYQEQVAATLGASRLQILLRITLPSIRHAVAYGVVLTVARALGEFGAVSLVSGRVAGRTQTLTIFIDERFQSFDLAGAYAASVVLALLAVGILLIMRRLARPPMELAA